LLGFGLRTATMARDSRVACSSQTARIYGAYDLKLGVPIKAMTPQLTAASEAALWKLYDQIQCPTLLIRGENSDLLSRETATAK